MEDRTEDEDDDARGSPRSSAAAMLQLSAQLELSDLEDAYGGMDVQKKERIKSLLHENLKLTKSISNAVNYGEAKSSESKERGDTHARVAGVQKSVESSTTSKSWKKINDVFEQERLAFVSDIEQMEQRLQHQRGINSRERERAKANELNLKKRVAELKTQLQKAVSNQSGWREEKCVLETDVSTLQNKLDGLKIKLRSERSKAKRETLSRSQAAQYLEAEFSAYRSESETKVRRLHDAVATLRSHAQELDAVKEAEARHHAERVEELERQSAMLSKLCHENEAAARDCAEKVMAMKKHVLEVEAREKDATVRSSKLQEQNQNLSAALNAAELKYKEHEHKAERRMAMFQEEVVRAKEAKAAMNNKQEKEYKETLQKLTNDQQQRETEFEGKIRSLVLERDRVIHEKNEAVKNMEKLVAIQRGKSKSLKATAEQKRREADEAQKALKRMKDSANETSTENEALKTAVEKKLEEAAAAERQLNLMRASVNEIVIGNPVNIPQSIENEPNDQHQHEVEAWRAKFETAETEHNAKMEKKSLEIVRLKRQLLETSELATKLRRGHDSIKNRVHQNVVDENPKDAVAQNTRAVQTMDVGNASSIAPSNASHCERAQSNETRQNRVPINGNNAQAAILPALHNTSGIEEELNITKRALWQASDTLKAMELREIDALKTISELRIHVKKEMSTRESFERKENVSSNNSGNNDYLVGSLRAEIGQLKSQYTSHLASHVEEINDILHSTQVRSQRRTHDPQIVLRLNSIVGDLKQQNRDISEQLARKSHECSSIKTELDVLNREKRELETRLLRAMKQLQVLGSFAEVAEESSSSLHDNLREQNECIEILKSEKAFILSRLQEQALTIHRLTVNMDH